MKDLGRRRARRAGSAATPTLRGGISPPPAQRLRAPLRVWLRVGIFPQRSEIRDQIRFLRNLLGLLVTPPKADKGCPKGWGSPRLKGSAQAPLTGPLKVSAKVMSGVVSVSGGGADAPRAELGSPPNDVGEKAAQKSTPGDTFKGSPKVAPKVQQRSPQTMSKASEIRDQSKDIEVPTEPRDALVSSRRTQR